MFAHDPHAPSLVEPSAAILALGLLLEARAETLASGDEPSGDVAELIKGAQGLALIALGLDDRHMEELVFRARHYHAWADETDERIPFDVWAASQE